MIAVILAQHNEAIGVDISRYRICALNSRQSPRIGVELSEYLAEANLNLSAITDLNSSSEGADYVIVSTPTNYDEKTFLREGKALYDILHPSGIVVGERLNRAEVFGQLLAQSAMKPNLDLLFTGAREAEAIKLFSAMRVAFFN